jgi:uncharacterized protein (DUF58 family)
MNLETVLKHSQIYNFWKWAARRNAPEEGRILLTQRRVYILPTRHGVVFAISLVLMLIGSINYNLSLGYVLTFLLAGMAVVSILHTFRNLAHLTVSGGKVEPVFAGGLAYFGLILDNARHESRRAIVAVCDGETVSTSVPARQTTSVQIPVRAQRRGWLMLPRVTLETRYPLGLFRAWSYVQPAMRTVAYPRPDLSTLPEPQPRPDTGDAVNVGVGTDDFAGLRDYQPSDSPRHIAWKAVASRDMLLTKAFMGRASRELVLDWNDLPAALDTEARLSRLARWVLLAHESGMSWGLRIPGSDIPIGAGEQQQMRCLQALALYDSRAS